MNISLMRRREIINLQRASNEPQRLFLPFRLISLQRLQFFISELRKNGEIRVHKIDGLYQRCVVTRIPLMICRILVSHRLTRTGVTSQSFHEIHSFIC